MLIKIESTFNGHRSRLVMRSGARSRVLIHETLAHETWTRAAARDALFLLETLYGIARRNVRFKVK